MEESKEETLEKQVQEWYKKKQIKEEVHPYFFNSTQKSPQFYETKVKIIDGKPVITCNKYTMGENILGLCWHYSGLIQILEGLKGEDREKVLEHELTHRASPMWSEATVREKTNTTDYTPNQAVSYTN